MKITRIIVKYKNYPVIRIGSIMTISASSILARNFREELHNQTTSICTVNSSRTNCLHTIVVFLFFHFLVDFYTYLRKLTKDKPKMRAIDYTCVLKRKKWNKETGEKSRWSFRFSYLLQHYCNTECRKFYILAVYRRSVYDRSLKRKHTLKLEI